MRTRPPGRTCTRHRRRNSRQEKRATRTQPTGAVGTAAPGRNDVMDMRRMLEALTPGMEHAEESDVGTQVLRIASQFEHRPGADAREQIVEHPLVLQYKSGK